LGAIRGPIDQVACDRGMAARRAEFNGNILAHFGKNLQALIRKFN
jgi:hypothetical protein